MLNELKALSKAIDEMGIKRDTWHREYMELPNVTVKAPCFRIWISLDGTVTGMEKLSPELVKTLRKFGNKQATFPAFNIKPLYRISDEGKERADNWLKSLKKIDRSLCDISQRLYEAMGDADFMKGCGCLVAKLIEATHALTGRDFRIELEKYVTAAVERGDDTVRDVLEHQGNVSKSPENDMSANISVILDLAEWRNCGGQPVAHEDTTLWINTALNHAESAISSVAQDDKRDAFGAYFNDKAKAEPMPEVKLPGFNVILRAMFSGQPCQKRYGRVDDATYPIAKSNRAAAKKAMEWIARAENEGVTWVKADKDEIVFVYPSKLPQVLPKFAALLTPVLVTESVKNKGKFEAVSKDFAKAFKGLPPEEKPKYIRIFSVRKMDKARSKVVFTRSLMPESYIEAADRWQTGCKNIPPIDGVVDGIDEDGIPAVPFPLQMAAIFNNVWKQDGERYDKPVKRIKYYQGIELLLDSDKAETEYFLQILLSNAAGLVFSFEKKNINPWYVANVTSMLGLLLYKCGYEREIYMENTAYLVGQFLKACDELHIFYGRVVRATDKDSGVPPQLAGNSVFITASETPDKALAQLGQRMNPYVTWAKSYRYKGVKESGKRSSTAAWLLNIYEELADKLQQTFTAPVCFGDFEKAQMFIGYLASLPQRKNDENITETDESIERGNK
jgi:hypothetical protein